jgi:hypothetical protein
MTHQLITEAALELQVGDILFRQRQADKIISGGRKTVPYGPINIIRVDQVTIRLQKRADVGAKDIHVESVPSLVDMADEYVGKVLAEPQVEF